LLCRVASEGDNVNTASLLIVEVKPDFETFRLQIYDNKSKLPNKTAKKNRCLQIADGSNTRGRFFLFDPLRRQLYQSNKKEPSPTVRKNPD